MNIDKIPAGKNPPSDINVVIEITGGAGGGAPVKYEIDKDSGAVFVDRIVNTPMFYPCNYGFVPNTLHADGDPTDVLVLCDFDLAPGVVIRCRPVGVLKMEDDGGMDDKLVAVPVEKVVANSYNPNVVAPPEMKLLELSIWEDGYTMPCVCYYDAVRDVYELVDGYHRYMVLKTSKRIYERERGLLPVAVIEKDLSHRMASTIRHNRARGTHNVELMSEIVAELREWRELAQRQFRLWADDPAAALFPESDMSERLHARLGRIEAGLEAARARAGAEGLPVDYTALYRYLGGFRGLSEATIGYAGVASHVAWEPWTEARF